MGEVSGTVAEAMLTTPTRHPLPATVREIREFFADEHVHAALIVNPDGYLTAVIERGDLVQGSADDAVAARLGHLAGRIAPASADLAETRDAMTANGRRRTAVVDSAGRLLGLLCLKASQTGFCSDDDVRARKAANAAAPAVNRDCAAAATPLLPHPQ